MTIVEWMNQVLVHKELWESFSESDQKSFSSYMITKWLSMDKEFIEIVNYFQKYAIGTLNNREVYKFYCEVLPRGKRYNKYIKNRKSKKYEPDLIDTICKYFECSKIQSKEFLKLLSKSKVKEILQMYGFNDKKIRKLIK